MKNETLRRYLAVALSVVLVLGSIPVRAIADATADDAEQAPVEKVASPEDEGTELEDADVADEQPSVTDETEGTDEAEGADEEVDDAAVYATVRAMADDTDEGDAEAKGSADSEVDSGADSDDQSDPTATSDESDASSAKLGGTPLLAAASSVEISDVSLTVTPPEAGTHSVSASVTSSTPGLSVAHASWKTFKGYSTDDPAELTFVEGDSYYVVVGLDVADGYTLKKGAGKPSLDIDACDYAFGGDTSVSGGTLDSAAFRSAERYGSEKLYIWAKATATAGSAQTVDMRVWTEGHGKVLVNGSDYGTEFQGTWYEGTEVQVEAVPDEGYKLESWWIQKSPGPNARVNDTAITLIAGTDLQANAAFALENASVTINPPEAGTTAATAPQITLPDGVGYSLDQDDPMWQGPSTHWVTSDRLYGMETLDESTVFEPGQTYYAYVRLAEGTDGFAATAGGSSFNTDLEVSGGTKTAQGNFAAWAEEHGGYMGIEAIIAVTIPEEAPSHELSFVFTNTFPGAAPQTLLESLTVNGEDWTPTSNNITAKDIPAGSSVSATVRVVDNASFAGHDNPGKTIAGLEPTYSDDGSEAAFSFTMPETDARIVVYLFETVTVNYDANGGVKDAGWVDSVKWMKYMASSQPASVIVSEQLYDLMNNQPRVQPPAGSAFAGIEVTQNKTGTTVTGAPGETITVDFSEGGTIKYLWENSPALTVHWSSIDGVDLMDPIVIKDVEKGTKLYEALGTVGLNMMSHPFEKEGYIAADYKLPKPITDYADYAAMEDDGVDAFAPIESDMDIYCIMLKTYDSVELTVEPPACGDTNDTPGGDWEAQTNPPKVSVPADAAYELDLFNDDHTASGLGAHWTADEAAETPFSGTFKGGNEYFFDAWIASKFGSVPSSDLSASINGGELSGMDVQEERAVVRGKVAVEHDPADPVEENRVDATCTDAGSYDEAVYCKGCKEELSRESKTISALGHDWGEWEVATPATCAAPGEEKRECSRCGEAEKREISVDSEAHEWGEWEQTKDPTCTEPGEEQRVCKVDPSHVEKREVQALGHDWGEWQQTKAPTCTEPGEEQRVCKVDTSHVEKREVQALDHDWDDGAVTTEPTCTDEGVRTYTCKRDPAHTRTEAISALGHDWGEWEVVNETTEEADGLERRACKRCEEVEERAIPKLVVEYTCVAGDGQTHVIGSGEALTFTFKRSVNDAVAFDHFTGVQVDGTALAAEEYSAESGSVVVTLVADYLDGLAAGKHTLTALFDDGNGKASASFTVEEEQEPAPEPTPESKSKPAPEPRSEPATTTKNESGTVTRTETANSGEVKPADKGSLPKTGDTFALAGLVSLPLALAGLVLALLGRRIRE